MIKTAEEILAEVDEKMRKQLDRDVGVFVLGYWQAMMLTTKRFETYGSFLDFVESWTATRPTLSLSDVSSAIEGLYESWRETL